MIRQVPYEDVRSVRYKSVLQLLPIQTMVHSAALQWQKLRSHADICTADIECRIGCSLCGRFGCFQPFFADFSTFTCPYEKQSQKCIDLDFHQTLMCLFTRLTVSNSVSSATVQCNYCKPQLSHLIFSTEFLLGVITFVL